MMSDILIPNPQDFQQKLASIIVGGKERLHLIADFDRTLTKAFVDGTPRSSLESILEQGGYLGSEYSNASKKLFEIYHPIEIDPIIPLEEKKKAMHQRWTQVFAMMLQEGLTRDIIHKTMTSNMIHFRNGAELFFDMLRENNIPLLIFSASGLGYEAIYHCLQNENKLSSNIDIISNAFIRDEQGKAIAIKEPIIHSFNKGETVVKDLPMYQKIKDRKNIILLGDSLGDPHMSDGFEYEHIIKIGFLNHDTPQNREKFQEKFDLIILNDGPMDEINVLLQKIVQKDENF